MREILVVDLGLVPYASALDLQRRAAAVRRAGSIPDLLLLCEHPPVVTIGRSGGAEHVGDEVARRGIPVYAVERGGDVTYHGPGQLVGYPVLALEGGERDLHRLLRGLEEAVLRTLGAFGVVGERLPGLTGVWLGNTDTGSTRQLGAPSRPVAPGSPGVPGNQAITGPKRYKVCAIGVAVRHWVSLHGFALNINVDLEPFGWIVPCGLHDSGVTSMRAALGTPVSLSAVQGELARHFGAVFSRVVRFGPLPPALSATPGERGAADGDDADFGASGGDGERQPE